MIINYLAENFVKSNCICTLVGHNYRITKKINDHFNEYECCRCKVQATNDDIGRKITLTSELKNINETLFYLKLRREFIRKFYIQKKS